MLGRFLLEPAESPLRFRASVPPLTPPARSSCPRGTLGSEHHFSLSRSSGSRMLSGRPSMSIRTRWSSSFRVLSRIRLVPPAGTASHACPRRSPEPFASCVGDSLVTSSVGIERMAGIGMLPRPGLLATGVPPVAQQAQRRIGPECVCDLPRSFVELQVRPRPATDGLSHSESDRQGLGVEPKVPVVVRGDFVCPKCPRRAGFLPSLTCPSLSGATTIRVSS